MFAQEVKQLHERFQRMKWKMSLKDDSAYHHNIEVRRELLEVNGGNIVFRLKQVLYAACVFENLYTFRSLGMR
jgi:hypothetical protein